MPTSAFCSAGNADTRCLNVVKTPPGGGSRYSPAACARIAPAPAGVRRLTHITRATWGSVSMNFEASVPSKWLQTFICSPLLQPHFNSLYLCVFFFFFL